MGQQQTAVRDGQRISWSVGSKLLVSVVSLLLASLAFLDASTILLLEKDKRAYTYQAQSTEAVLVGRELTGSVRHALDSLRTVLAAVDPFAPITTQQSATLQSLVDNQSAIVSAALHLFPQEQPLTQVFKTGVLHELGIEGSALRLPAQLLAEARADLLKDGVALLNASVVGGAPLVAILMADLKLKDNPGGLPVAIGFVSLKGWGRELDAPGLTIANRDGWVLFDTDPAAVYSRKNILDDPLFVVATSAPLGAGAREYVDTDGTRTLGSYVKPGYGLVILARTEWRQATASTRALTEKFVLLGCMAIGAAIIFAILFAKTISSPITALVDATRKVGSGDFNLKLAPGGRDEIGALTASFGIMSRKIADLIQESIQKVKLENELAIASTVQQTLIPPAVIRTPDIEIRSRYQSASQCGGDWWGTFQVGRKTCLMIADATGHGLPSALITASARSCFSVMHKLAEEDPGFGFSPAVMLSYANRVVLDAAGGKIMMTLFIATLDFESRRLTYASAGHNPPWLYRRQGEGYSQKSLTSLGHRLGEAADLPGIVEQSTDIEPGDLLVLYTDGILEGKSRRGEAFGKKRARKAVEAALASGPQAVVDTLMDDFMAFNDGKPLDDDVTLAVARLLPDSGTT